MILLTSGLEVVIALSPTTFVLWPGSHKVTLNPGGSGYYALKARDMATLEAAGVVKAVIPAAAGDVLFFLGGKMVHGSPGVADGDGARIATYAHWIPPA